MVLVHGHGVEVKGHLGQGQPKAHDIGRWAHINVKLLQFDADCILLIVVALQEPCLLNMLPGQMPVLKISSQQTSKFKINLLTTTNDKTISGMYRDSIGVQISVTNFKVSYFYCRWCQKKLELVSHHADSKSYEKQSNSEEYQLVFDGYQPESNL